MSGKASTKPVTPPRKIVAKAITKSSKRRPNEISHEDKSTNQLSRIARAYGSIFVGKGKLLRRSLRIKALGTLPNYRDVIANVKVVPLF